MWLVLFNEIIYFLLFISQARFFKNPNIYDVGGNGIQWILNLHNVDFEFHMNLCGYRIFISVLNNKSAKEEQRIHPQRNYIKV
jgi:hypothetical protein